MAKAKKTIQVQRIKDFANQRLNSPNLTMEEKMGIITMIEHVLHGANCYNGYMYTVLDADGSAPRLGTEGWVNRKYF